MPKQKNSWQTGRARPSWLGPSGAAPISTPAEPAFPAPLPFWLRQPADGQSQTIGQNFADPPNLLVPHSPPSEQKQIRGHAGFCPPAFFCRDAWETRAVARPRPPADQPSATVAGPLKCREPNHRPSRSRIFGARCGGPAGGSPLLPLLNVGAYCHCEERTKTSAREPDGPESAAIRSCQELDRSGVVVWPATTDRKLSVPVPAQWLRVMAKKTAEFRAAHSVCVVSNRAAGSSAWVAFCQPTNH
jgi:hypothetical protein